MCCFKWFASGCIIANNPKETYGYPESSVIKSDYIRKCIEDKTVLIIYKNMTVIENIRINL